MDQEDRLEALDEHLHQATEGLDRVRDSVAQLDARLRELTEAQEGIELQLALLSKEAEQYDSWLRLSDPDSEFSHRQRSENGKLYAIEQQVLALAESVEQLGGRQPTEVGVRDAPRHWANIESDLTEDRRRIDLLLTRIDALEAEVADAQLAVADVDSRLLGGDVSAPESADPSGTPNAAVTHALDAVVGDRPHRVHHDIHALKVAGGMLLDRLSTLEQQRRQLKSSISAIGVEQARRDEESLQLRRQLRRRSLVSGLALVLASVSVFVVFQQGLLKAADERVAEVEPVVTTSMLTGSG
jgi:cell division septum initiation protein DivIVA